jgi:hypothetical protein
MYAVVNSKGLVAKDFPTKPAALAWIKQYDNPALKVIDQNSKQYLKYGK